MSTIQAVFENGVFRPIEPVALADGTLAEVIPRVSAAPTASARWPAGYFEETAGSLAGEEFERPAQGDLPTRNGW